MNGFELARDELQSGSDDGYSGDGDQDPRGRGKGNIPRSVAACQLCVSAPSPAPHFCRQAEATRATEATKGLIALEQDRQSSIHCVRAQMKCEGPSQSPCSRCKKVGASQRVSEFVSS